MKFHLTLRAVFVCWVDEERVCEIEFVEGFWLELFWVLGLLAIVDLGWSMCSV